MQYYIWYPLIWGRFDLAIFFCMTLLMYRDAKNGLCVAARNFWLRSTMRKYKISPWVFPSRGHEISMVSHTHSSKHMSLSPSKLLAPPSRQFWWLSNLLGCWWCRHHVLGLFGVPPGGWFGNCRILWIGVLCPKSFHNWGELIYLNVCRTQISWKWNSAMPKMTTSYPFFVSLGAKVWWVWGQKWAWPQTLQ